jgi:hypothetical protein
MLADTGGELPAPSGPIVGSADILRFLALVAAEHPPFTATEVEVNGEPGLLFHAGGEPHYLWTAVVDAEGKVPLFLDVGGPTKFTYAKRQRLRLPA